MAADRGEGEAQSDLGGLFLEGGRADIAAYWFQLAADQGNADAMHYLSGMYQKGHGVDRCENTAMQWRAKAAGAGHMVAQAQMAALKSRIDTE